MTEDTTTPTPTPIYDVMTQIIAFEDGEMENEDDVIELFQHLVDSGWVWQLQGRYGRTAMDLIRAGLVTLPEREG